MSVKLKKCSFVFVCFFVFSLPLFCAFSSENVELGKVVVTPYRGIMHKGASAASIEVINVDSMDEKGIYSLKGALTESASIVSSSSGSLGGETSIFLRGHNSYHTRFMVDGIKVYGPLITSAYYNFAHFNLNGIDKVEISKGPQSSLYGSDAIGGVIQLFTKKASFKKDFSFTQTVGSYNFFKESLSFSQRKNDFGYALAFSRMDVGGYSQSKEKNNNHERDPYSNFNGSIALDYEFSKDTTLDLIARYIYAKYEYDGSSISPPYLPIDDDNNISHNHDGIISTTLKQEIGENISSEIKLGFTRSKRTSWSDSTSDNWYDSKTYQANWKGDFEVNSNYKIILGVDYLEETGDSYNVYLGSGSDFPKASANNKGYFIEHLLEPCDNLFLSGSYRVDDHSSFGSEDTFRFTSSYLFDSTKTKLKALYGRGMKNPSLYQLFSPPSWGSPVGNSNLDPERSGTYELGVSQEIGEKINYDVLYFHSKIKDMIDYTFGTGYTNVAKSRIKGVENSIGYQLNEKLKLGLSYTWLDARNNNTRMELARRPSNKVTLKTKFNCRKISTNFDLSYIGHRYSDNSNTQLLKPYVLGNFSLNYDKSENVNLFARIENVFNEKYEEIAGYQTPKFSWYLGTKISF